MVRPLAPCRWKCRLLDRVGQREAARHERGELGEHRPLGWPGSAPGTGAYAGQGLVGGAVRSGRPQLLAKPSYTSATKSPNPPVPFRFGLFVRPRVPWTKAFCPSHLQACSAMLACRTGGTYTRPPTQPCPARLHPHPAMPTSAPTCTPAHPTPLGRAPLTPIIRHPQNPFGWASPEHKACCPLQHPSRHDQHC